MPHERKTRALYVVQGYYGTRYGWEDVTADHDRRAALNDLRTYRENETQYPHRLITRRVRIETPPTME